MKFILKILLIFSLVMGTTYAQEVTFAFLTDAKVNPNNAYKLQHTIKELNSNNKIDFVVFAGNNISSPNPDNLNYFTYLLKRVRKKTYVLLGSSDVSTSKGLDKELYLKRVKKARFLRHPSTPNYVFKKGGIVFIAMDGAKQYFPQSNGCYTKNELLWLKSQLEKYKDKNVIILQHFPSLETDSKWLQTAKLQDYYIVLKDYKNVKMIVSGHYDKNLEQKTGWVNHILTENYSKEGAYRIITVDFKNNFTASYLIK